MSERWVALLRGVNVGGNNMISMASWRQALEAVGFENVKTLLQSGNAVFTTAELDRNSLEQAVQGTIASLLPPTVGVFVRKQEELKDLVEASPMKPEASDPSRLLVVFCRSEVGEDAVADFRAAVTGREVIDAWKDHLVVYFPDGMGKSKLVQTKAWRRWACDGTARNWNTVMKLAEL